MENNDLHLKFDILQLFRIRVCIGGNGEFEFAKAKSYIIFFILEENTRAVLN